LHPDSVSTVLLPNVPVYVTDAVVGGKFVAVTFTVNLNPPPDGTHEPDCTMPLIVSDVGTAVPLSLKIHSMV
jgi:hypothetical protein